MKTKTGYKELGDLDVEFTGEGRARLVRGSAGRATEDQRRVVPPQPPNGSAPSSGGAGWRHPAHAPLLLISRPVYGVPVPKPRMTRRDGWKPRPGVTPRPCVLRYRAWRDALRRSIPRIPVPAVWRGYRVSLVFYLPCPRSRQRHADRPHDVKPDVDNLAKGVLDALFAHDESVTVLHSEKHWVDEGGPRVEVEITG